MKKILILLLLPIISFSDKIEIYGKGNLKKDENQNNRSEISLGAKYKGLSVEAIYKKNFDVIGSNARDYLKKGNSVGISFSYDLDDDHKTKDTIIVEDLNTFNHKKENFNLYYKLKNEEKLKNTLLDIKRVSGFDKISLNAYDINKVDLKKTIEVLNLISKKINKEYGVLNNDKIVDKNFKNTGKYVLKFNKKAVEINEWKIYRFVFS